MENKNMIQLLARIAHDLVAVQPAVYFEGQNNNRFNVIF